MAALQKLADEFLTCVICQDVFKDPVTLHCGHTVCSSCITPYLLRQPQAVAEQSIPCPCCRSLTKVPDPSKPVELWAKMLKTGFFVKGLVETFLVDKPMEDAILCSPCKEGGEITPADKWCTDCSEALCEKCLQLHRQYPKFRNHATTDVTEAGKLKQVTSKKQFCQEHKEEPIKLFCNDCDVAICQICCSVFHRKCDSVLTLSEACPKMKGSLKEKLEELKVTMAKSQSTICDKNRQLTRLTESCDTSLEDLDDAVEEIVKVIQVQQILFREKITGKMEEAAQKLKKDKCSAEEELKVAESKAEVIETMPESASEFELYETYKDLCSKTGPIPDTKAKVKNYSQNTIEVNFEDHVESLTKMLMDEQLGQLEFIDDKSLDTTFEPTEVDGAKPKRNPKRKKRPAKNKQGTQEVEGNSSTRPSFHGKGGNMSRASSTGSLSSELSFLDSTDQALKQATGKPHKPFENPMVLKICDFSFESDPQKVHIEDMITMSMDNKTIIIVSDWGNKKVKTFVSTLTSNPRSDQKMYLNLPEHPFGLTKISDNEVAVAVSFAYKIFTFNILPAMRFTGHIKTKDRYSYISHLGSRVFVASDYSRSNIDILNGSGDVTKTIKVDEIGQGLVFKANVPGQFLVSDRQNRTVLRLSTNNKVLFKFQPSGPHRFGQNIGLSMDKSGHTYIVDRGTNKVIVLSHQGRFIKMALKFLDKTEKLAYISVDEQHRMYTTMEERYVYVYQLTK